VNHLSAQTLSRTVRDQLVDQPFAGRVLAVFARACVIASQDGRVVSIVGPELGDGPLNIVLRVPGFSFQGIPESGRAWVEDGRLWTHGLEVAMSDAAIWEPRPNWSRLRARRTFIVNKLPLLRSSAFACAPDGSLLTLFARGEPHSEPTNFTPSALQAALRAGLSLRAVLHGEPRQVGSATSQLAGLGSGLTPAGDDFLAGVMLRTWLEHSAPEPLCWHILEAAAPHTSVLSTAFLRAASRGECSAAWHQLFDALDNGYAPSIRHAVRKVLSYGHTSGADTLAGFLWLDSVPNGTRSLSSGTSQVAKHEPRS
jgi:hypothetical protein